MAMKFNLEELNPGTWFDLGEEARICLRVSNKDLLSAINKKATKQQMGQTRPPDGHGNR